MPKRQRHRISASAAAARCGEACVGLGPGVALVRRWPRICASRVASGRDRHGFSLPGLAQAGTSALCEDNQVTQTPETARCNPPAFFSQTQCHRVYVVLKITKKFSPKMQKERLRKKKQRESVVSVQRTRYCAPGRRSTTRHTHPPRRRLLERAAVCPSAATATASDALQPPRPANRTERNGTNRAAGWAGTPRAPATRTFRASNKIKIDGLDAAVAPCSGGTTQRLARPRWVEPRSESAACAATPPCAAWCHRALAQTCHRRQCPRRES